MEFTVIAAIALDFAVLFILGGWFRPAGAEAGDGRDPFAAARQRMVDEQLSGWGRDITNERVLAAMGKVPRHEFILPTHRRHAYEDGPLPIGHEQTISQPYIVAFMTEKLEPKSADRVLEIGTGSGYQTAVLAQLVDQVYSVERISHLLTQARQRLHSLHLHNVNLRMADGYQGWDKHAPFDAIIVTAAPEVVPKQLLQQLVVGGRMVIPVGKPLQQRLLLITREEEGYAEQALDWVSFVPMVKGQSS